MATGPVQNVAITTSHGEINATAVKHPKVPVEVVIVVAVVTEEVATAVEEETIEAAVETVVTTAVVIAVEEETIEAVVEIVVVVVTEEAVTAVTTVVEIVAAAEIVVEVEIIEVVVVTVETTVVVVTVETTEMEIAEITIEAEMTTDHRVENIEVAMIEEHPVVILENPVAGAQKARAGPVDAEITRGAFM